MHTESKLTGALEITSELGVRGSLAGSIRLWEENDHAHTKSLSAQPKKDWSSGMLASTQPTGSIMIPILSDIGQQEAQVRTVEVACGTGLAHLGIGIH